MKYYFIKYSSEEKEHFPIYNIKYYWKGVIGKIIDVEEKTACFPYFMPQLLDLPLGHLYNIWVSAIYNRNESQIERNLSYRFIDPDGRQVGPSIEYPIFPVRQPYHKTLDNSYYGSIISDISTNFKITIRISIITRKQFTDYKQYFGNTFYPFNVKPNIYHMNACVNLDEDKYKQWSLEANEENKKMYEDKETFSAENEKINKEYEDFRILKQIERQQDEKKKLFDKIVENKGYTKVCTVNPCISFVNRFDQTDICLQICIEFINNKIEKNSYLYRHSKDDNYFKDSFRSTLEYAVLLLELLNGEKNWITDLSSTKLICTETKDMELYFIPDVQIELEIDKSVVDHTYFVQLRDLLYVRSNGELKCNEIELLTNFLNAFIRDLHFTIYLNENSDMDQTEIELIMKYWIHNLYIVKGWRPIYLTNKYKFNFISTFESDISSDISSEM